jgi:hypothetical protein
MFSTESTSGKSERRFVYTYPQQLTASTVHNTLFTVLFLYDHYVVTFRSVAHLINSLVTNFNIAKASTEYTHYTPLTSE